MRRFDLAAIALAVLLSACSRSTSRPPGGTSGSSGSTGAAPCVDNDHDGYTTCDHDCDDNDPAVHPGATEVCDGKDNNCDGRIDEGCECVVGSAAQPCGASGSSCVRTCRPNGTLAACEPANGGPIDPQTDPKNCGLCGHVCPSSTCTAGLCGCASNADCASTEACDQSGLCRPATDPCATKTCASGAVCRGGTCATVSCGANADCDPNEVCSPSGQCRRTSDPCATIHCSAGTVCRSGQCQVTPCGSDQNCGAGEKCGSDGVCRVIPDPCASVTCSGDTVCRNGSCKVVTCSVASDCQASESCTGGLCLTSADACSSVGACALGAVCRSGTCAPVPCSAASDCASGEKCAGGLCRPPTDPCGTIACPAGQVCRLSGDPATGACASVPCAADGDCALGERCGGGVCRPPQDPCAGITCTALDGCHGVGTCSASSAGTPACSNPPKADGSSCGAGQICSAGTCSAGCDLGGAFFAAGAPNPANACQSCQPAVSTSTWSKLADGSGCGSGRVCSSGTCQAGCYINGSFVAADAVDLGTGCQSCQPSVSTSAWTRLSDGSICANGKICLAGTCKAGCYIGSAYYASNVVDPSNGCQSCQPTVDSASWSLLPAGTTCRPIAGPCDLAETCTGSSGACPGDAFQSSTVVCRPAAGPCDLAEYCSGSSASCPADALASAATVCRPAAGPCDAPEYCNGSSASCPADQLDPAGTVCRASAGPCDVAEYCDGTSTSCPTNAFATDGTSCGSGQVCNGGACQTMSPPSIAFLSPKHGLAGGGTSVTLTGTGFSLGGANTVYFDTTAATNVTTVDDRTITCTTPAHAAGAVDVTVINNRGIGKLASGYTYDPQGGPGSDGAPVFTPGSYAVNASWTLAADVLVGGTYAVLNTPSPASILPRDELLFVNVLGAGAGAWTVMTVDTVQANYPGAGQTYVTFYGGTYNAAAKANAFTANTSSTEVVRIEQYSSLTVPSGVTLIATPFDVSKGLGGILAIRSQSAIDVEGALSVTGLGFAQPSIGYGLGAGGAGGAPSMAGGIGQGGSNGTPANLSTMFFGGVGGGGGGGGGGTGSCWNSSGTNSYGGWGGGSGGGSPGYRSGCSTGTPGSPGQTGGGGSLGQGGGGLMLVWAPSISGNGAIHADGASGLNGSNVSSECCGAIPGGPGGAGGGAAGGVVWLDVSSASITPTVAGGAGGTFAGTGQAGSTGIYKIGP